MRFIAYERLQPWAGPELHSDDPAPDGRGSNPRQPPLAPAARSQPPLKRRGLGERAATWEAGSVPRVNRRTATRVRDGRVQKKNNWAPSPGDYRTVPQADIPLERRKPADGYRHVVTLAQLRAFVDLLPEWETIAVGVRAIVLDSDIDCYGWYQAGTIAICNWQHD